MSIETKHPEYIVFSTDYRVMSDSHGGQRRIKEGTFAYLPPTGGQVADGVLTNLQSKGYASYLAYLKRAVYPEFVQEASDLLVGVMHQEPAQIQLPARLEPMRERATRDGSDLQMLLRNINLNQLLFGRYGLLVDFPQDPFFASQAEVPHLVEYDAMSIINWDDQALTEFTREELTFAVANETVLTRGEMGTDIFAWDEDRVFRVFQLTPEDPAFPLSAENQPIYSTFSKTDEMESAVVTPMFRGRTLDFIPFTFIGARDLNSDPDIIPLLKLAELALSIYNQEADYKQALHVLGQDTLVVAGQELGADGQAKQEGSATRLGAGAVIRLDEDGDAKFIGINAEGVPEMRTSLENDKGRAQALGPRLLEPRRGQAESGEALKTRVRAQTATLKSIALTGAKGLEKALRQCAEWVGANPDEVRVIPNLDFTQDSVPAAELKSMSEATGRPFPLSVETMHKWAQDRNFTRLTFPEELELIENNPPPVSNAGPNASGSASNEDETNEPDGSSGDAG